MFVFSKWILNIERLEAQLKACHCCFTFTKIKVSCSDPSALFQFVIGRRVFDSGVIVSLQPSLLALALMALETEDQHEYEPVPALREALDALQQSLTVSLLHHVYKDLLVCEMWCRVNWSCNEAEVATDRFFCSVMYMQVTDWVLMLFGEVLHQLVLISVTRKMQMESLNLVIKMKFTV